MLREAFAFPPDKQRELRRARRLEWITLLCLSLVGVLMYLTLGNSQAMRTAWLEDLLSLVPPIVFLICSRVQERAPGPRFPFGYLRAMNIAFAVASASLVALGGFMLIDAAVTLAMREHPTIGGVEVLGATVWMGWLMIGALFVSAVPPMILGRMKLRIAESLHEKTLHADAAMNKADWTTALAAIVGILCVGLGWWWADAVAAAFISFEILRDGWRHLGRSLADACDQRATRVGSQRPDPVIDLVRDAIAGSDDVRDFDLRLCAEGVALTGDVLVVLRPGWDREGGGERLLRGIEDAARAAHWRVHDIRVRPVERITERFL